MVLYRSGLEQPTFSDALYAMCYMTIPMYRGQTNVMFTYADRMINFAKSSQDARYMDVFEWLHEYFDTVEAPVPLHYATERGSQDRENYLRKEYEMLTSQRPNLLICQPPEVNLSILQKLILAFSAGRD